MTDRDVNEAVARELGWKNPCLFQNDERHPVCECPFKIPDYCHSIEAAWELVTTFLASRALGRFKLKKMTVTRWHATFDDSFIERAESVADTVPRAICEAFLALKGVSVEGDK